MVDLLFVAIVIAFFALAVGLVRACDAIIGPDPDLSPADTPPTADVATTAEAAR